MKEEGVVLGLVAIRRPVSSRRSRSVFVVWTRRHALGLCPRCRVVVLYCHRRAYTVCCGRVALWPWWLWCGVVVVVVVWCGRVLVVWCWCS